MKKYKMHCEVSVKDGWYCSRKRKFVKGYCDCEGTHSSSYSVRTIKQAERIANKLLNHYEFTEVVVDRYINYKPKRGHLIETFTFTKR